MYEYEIESSAASKQELLNKNYLKWMKEKNKHFHVFVLCTPVGLTYCSHTINTVAFYNWLLQTVQ